MGQATASPPDYSWAAELYDSMPNDFRDALHPYAAPSPRTSGASTTASAFSRGSGGQSSYGGGVPPQYRTPKPPPYPQPLPPATGPVQSVFDQFAGLFSGVSNSFAGGFEYGAGQYQRGLTYSYDVPGLDAARSAVGQAVRDAAGASSLYVSAARDARSIMREGYRPLRLDPALFRLPAPASLPVPFGERGGGGGAARWLVVGGIAAAGFVAFRAWRKAKRARGGGAGG